MPPETAVKWAEADIRAGFIGGMRQFFSMR